MNKETEEMVTAVAGVVRVVKHKTYNPDGKVRAIALASNSITNYLVSVAQHDSDQCAEVRYPQSRSRMQEWRPGTYWSISVG